MQHWAPHPGLALPGRDHSPSGHPGLCPLALLLARGELSVPLTPLRASGRFTKIQNTKVTMKRDGISSLQYQLVEVTRWPMYTNITVDIGKPPPRPARG